MAKSKAQGSGRPHEARHQRRSGKGAALRLHIDRMKKFIPLLGGVVVVCGAASFTDPMTCEDFRKRLPDNVGCPSQHTLLGYHFAMSDKPIHPAVRLTPSPAGGIPDCRGGHEETGEGRLWPSDRDADGRKYFQIARTFPLTSSEPLGEGPQFGVYKAECARIPWMMRFLWRAQQMTTLLPFIKGA